MSSNTITTENILDVMRAKARARLKPLELRTLSRFYDPNLQEAVMEAVRQVLKASPALATYAKKDACVGEIYYIHFHAGQSSVGLINEGQLVHNFLNSVRQSTIDRLDITTSSVLWMQIFFTEWSNDIRVNTNKHSRLLLIVLDNDDDRLYCTDNLKGIDSSFKIS